MSNFSQIVANLQSERSRVQKELQRLDDAISALGGIAARASVSKGEVSTVARGPRRKLSAAARKKIADAQKQRWAKFRQQKGSARKVA